MRLNSPFSHEVRNRGVVLRLDDVHVVGVHRHHVEDDLGRVVDDLETLVDGADHVDVPSTRKCVHLEFTIQLGEGKHERYRC